MVCTCILTTQLIKLKHMNEPSISIVTGIVPRKRGRLVQCMHFHSSRRGQIHQAFLPLALENKRIHYRLYFHNIQTNVVDKRPNEVATLTETVAFVDTLPNLGIHIHSGRASI